MSWETPIRIELDEGGIVESISGQSVQRILASYRLKPWRVHYWLNAKAPRDAEFRRRTEEICELSVAVGGDVLGSTYPTVGFVGSRD